MAVLPDDATPEEIEANDEARIQEVRAFFAALTQAHSLSPLFFAEVAALMYMYLRLVFDENTVFGMLNYYLQGMEDGLAEATVTLKIEGEDYELPFLTAEQGGLEQLGADGQSLHDLVSPPVE